MQFPKARHRLGISQFRFFRMVHSWLSFMKDIETKKELSAEQREELLRALKARFEKNMNRHKGLEWAKVKAKLDASAEKLWSLNEMERTGGEPDVVGHDKKT